MAPKEFIVCFLCSSSFTVERCPQRHASFTSRFRYTWKPESYRLLRLEWQRNKQRKTNWYKLGHLAMQSVNGQECNNRESFPSVAPIPTNSALVEGIRQVAIGKYGAKSLSKSLSRSIIEELEHIEAQMRNWNNSAEDNSLYQHQVLQRAAFLGSLYMKTSLTEDEQEILRKYELGHAPLHKPCSEASLLLAVHPNSFQRLEECHLLEHVLKLLQGDHLNVSEAEQLGEFILECKTLTDACLSAMILHVLRVRHETSSELIGLASACRKAMEIEDSNASRKSNVSTPSRRSVMQITEPFDGVVKSPMITPLIAKHITEKYGIWTVLIGSDTSGPKYGMNLKTLVHQLGEDRIPRVGSRSHLEEIFQTSSSPRVLYMDLEDTCNALSRLTYLRRAIIKRPCFATIEKAINYLDADFLLTSAFHPNYVEKMLRIGESQRFRDVFVVSGGIEGGLAFPISGRSGITVTSFSQDSQKVTPTDVLSDTLRSKIRYENSSSWLSYNSELISHSWDQTNSGNEVFDAIVRATLQALNDTLPSKLESRIAV